MKTLAFTRYGVCIVVGAGLLAGCGGSQPMTGAVPGAVAQTARLPASTSYKVLRRFAMKKFPNSALIDVNGTLYGTTYGIGGRRQGTVYSITPAGVTKTLHRFHGGADGASPLGALLDVDGTLYGTTVYGGASNDGVVFSVTTSGAENVVYSFKGGTDGENPYGGLVDVNGILYGTTYAGGDSACYRLSNRSCGTVFSVTTAGAETVLHTFTGGSDGSAPWASLVDLNGTLYGTTYSGGAADLGVVFAISTSGAERVIYSFTGNPDGAYPKAGLVAVKGTLYGTTYYGGGYANCRADPGCGAVFSVKPSGEEHVLYGFRGGSDGSNPDASLIEVKGTLYGTTFTGGSYPCGYLDLGCGTVYSVTASGSEKVLHSFTSGLDGAFPYGSLVSMGSALYGTTTKGGSDYTCTAQGCGTVFALTP